MNHQSQQKVLFVQTFIVFHNTLQPTWPSSELCMEYVGGNQQH